MLRDSLIAGSKCGAEVLRALQCTAPTYITACPWAFAPPHCLAPKESHASIRTSTPQSRNVISRCAAGCVGRVE